MESEACIGRSLEGYSILLAEGMLEGVYRVVDTYTPWIDLSGSYESTARKE